VNDPNRQAEHLTIGGGFQRMITEAAVGLAQPLHADLRVAAPEVLRFGEGGIAQRPQWQRKKPFIQLGHARQRNAVSNGSLRSLRIALGSRLLRRRSQRKGLLPLASFQHGGARSPRELVRMCDVSTRSRVFVVTVAVRVIPCLDVHAGRVVKGVNFVSLRDAGDPVELGAFYDAAGADELTFLDISASVEGRETTLEVVRRTAETVFIPLTVGGGVSSVGDVDVLLRAGADKVAINTGAIRRPDVIGEITRRFGNQVLVLSVDARRADWAPSGYEVTTHGGRTPAGLDAVEWARRGVDQGVGEILLNSMDADGTTAGFDLAMIRAIRAVVDVPLIASGGAGRVADFPPAIAAGADAVLAATVFHFGTLRIAEVKSAIEAAGFPVRRGALAPTAGH
jgi:imidazole glycerol-phosphate synthase subunit HisF